MKGVTKKRAQEWVDKQYHDVTLTAEVVQQVKETVGLAVAQGNPIDLRDCIEHTIRQMDLSPDDLTSLWVDGILLRQAADRVTNAPEVAETERREEVDRPIPEPVPISERPVEDGSRVAVYRASTKEQQDAMLLEMYQSFDVDSRELAYRVISGFAYRDSDEKAVA